jgi:hypothetical protein
MRNGGGYYGFSRLKSPMTKEATAMSCASETMEEKGKLTADEIKRGILSKPTKPRIQPVERKITQISANTGGVWALCDDGSLWFGAKDGWREFEPIPLGVREIEEPSRIP